MLSKLLPKRLPLQFSRPFCSQITSTPQTQPCWATPYDPKKYEVLTSKIKTHTGYAFMDIEPMPRAKLMKIGYIILDKLKAIDEHELFRIYQEEKTKWIMEQTDAIEDVQELEAV